MDKMDKGEYALHSRGPYVAHDGSPDGIPGSELGNDQDNLDLAMFGKRPQLKVSSPESDRSCVQVVAHQNAAPIWLHFHGRFDMYPYGNMGGVVLVRSFQAIAVFLPSLDGELTN